MSSFRQDSSVLATLLALGAMLLTVACNSPATPRSDAILSSIATPVFPQVLEGTLVSKCDPRYSPHCQTEGPYDGSVSLVEVTGTGGAGPPTYPYKYNVIAVGETDSSGEFPIPFTITYDTEDINTSRHYAIIVDYEQKWFVDDWSGIGTSYSNANPFGREPQPTLVLTKGHPRNNIEVKIAVSDFTIHSSVWTLQTAEGRVPAGYWTT